MRVTRIAVVVRVVAGVGAILLFWLIWSMLTAEGHTHATVHVPTAGGGRAEDVSAVRCVSVLRSQQGMGDDWPVDVDGTSTTRFVDDAPAITIACDRQRVGSVAKAGMIGIPTTVLGVFALCGSAPVRRRVDESGPH